MADTAAHLIDRVDAEVVEAGQATRCVSVGGISLHANVCVPARDRARLERLCCYVARPPVSSERLSLMMTNGLLLYRLRHRWRDGTTHTVYGPRVLLARLAALVPAVRVLVGDGEPEAEPDECTETSELDPAGPEDAPPAGSMEKRRGWKLEPIGNIPPAECEAMYHLTQDSTAAAAGVM